MSSTSGTDQNTNGIDVWNLKFPLETKIREKVAYALLDELPGNIPIRQATNLLLVLDLATESDRSVRVSEMMDQYDIVLARQSFYNFLTDYWKPIVTKTKTGFRLDRKGLTTLLVERHKRNGGRTPRQSPKTKGPANNGAGIGLVNQLDIPERLAELMAALGNPAGVMTWEKLPSFVSFLQAAMNEPDLEVDLLDRRMKVSEFREQFKENVGNVMYWFIVGLFAYLFTTYKGIPSNEALLKELLEKIPPVEFDDNKQIIFSMFYEGLFLNRL